MQKNVENCQKIKKLQGEKLKKTKQQVTKFGMAKMKNFGWQRQQLNFETTNLPKKVNYRS